MNKILFYCVSTHLGGAERSLLDLLVVLQKGPNECLVIVPKSEGPLLTELKKLNVRYTVLKLPNLFLQITRKHYLASSMRLLFVLPQLYTYTQQLVGLINNYQPSTIHSTGLKCHILLCLLSHKTKARIIIHFRDIITNKWLKKFFKHYVNQPNIHWLANSRATARSQPSVNTAIFYNLLSSTTFSPNKNDILRSQLSVPREHLVIGMNSIVTPWKGQHVFLAAAHSLRQQNLNYHFVISGDQIYDTAASKNYLIRLKKMVVDLKLSQCVHFTGFSDNPAQFINGLDLLVHASTQPEPFGRVIVEAMLCNIMVVAANAGGATEILTQGKTGFFHKPGDSDDLARTITQALNSDNAEEIRRNAFNYAGKTFSLENNTQAIKNLFEKDMNSSVKLP